MLAVYLPTLQQAILIITILTVLRKHVERTINAVSVNYEQKDDEEILEPNIVLPENPKRQ